MDITSHNNAKKGLVGEVDNFKFPDNFAIFRPQKKIMHMEIRLNKSQEIEEFIESSGIELLDYFSRNRSYRINLKPGDVEKYKTTLTALFKKSLGIEDEEERNT